MVIALILGVFNQASNTYVRNKARNCENLGIDFEHIHIKEYDMISENMLKMKLHQE